jgi:hypothetical protein
LQTSPEDWLFVGDLNADQRAALQQFVEKVRARRRRGAKNKPEHVYRDYWAAWVEFERANRALKTEQRIAKFLRTAARRFPLLKITSRPGHRQAVARGRAYALDLSQRASLLSVRRRRTSLLSP